MGAREDRMARAAFGPTSSLCRGPSSEEFSRLQKAVEELIAEMKELRNTVDVLRRYAVPTPVDLSGPSNLRHVQTVTHHDDESDCIHGSFAGSVGPV